MITIDNLIDEIQDQNIPVSSLLRKAKVVASKLDQTDFLKWIDLELNGYAEGSVFPDYRNVQGEVMGLNPYRGWQPVIFKVSKIERQVSHCPCKRSISEIEELLRDYTGTYEIPYQASVAAQILKDVPFPAKVSLFFGSAELVKILSGARDVLLDWALKLEKDDNIGDAPNATLLGAVVRAPKPSLPDNKVIEAKIMATKPPSFTMKTLRPLANLLAEYTSPSQIASIARQFGFEESASTPDEVATALLRMFEALRGEGNDEDIRKIIETLLTLYAHLIDERLHDKGLIGPAREILRLGHFALGFHIVKKEYVLKPFEGPVHGAIMHAEGTTEEDFQDGEKHKMRISSSINKRSAKYRKGGQIAKLEIVSGMGRIKVYINGDYSRELDFSRGKMWSEMYKLADNGHTDLYRGLVDYFNSSQRNPLYAKHQFMKTKILKIEDGVVVPNIKIALISRKKVTQQLNSA